MSRDEVCGEVWDDFEGVRGAWVSCEGEVL